MNLGDSRDVPLCQEGSPDKGGMPLLSPLSFQNSHYNGKIVAFTLSSRLRGKVMDINEKAANESGKYGKRTYYLTMVIAGASVYGSDP